MQSDNMLPPRIIHVFPYPFTVSGGHSNAIRAFMKGQIAASANVFFYCPKSDDPDLRAFESPDGLPLRNANSSDDKELCRISENNKVIFHFYGIDSLSIQIASKLRSLRIPYYFTSEGALHYRNKLNFMKKFGYLNFATRFIRCANGIHYLTTYEKERARMLLPGYRGKILVAPNAVDIPTILPSPFQRSTFGIPSECFLFLFLGRIHIKHKGLDFVVNALSRLRDNPDIHMAFAGPDWQNGRARLINLAEKLGCTDRIHWIEPQYGDNKWALLQIADAFISPSRWDAFNIALVEAIGLGIPCITSESINLAQDLKQHSAAIVTKLCPNSLSDAMRKLYSDTETKNTITLNGLNWVREHCSSKQVGKNLLNFY